MWESRAGAGALVVHEGRVLMELLGRSTGYHWELPSGYIEAGETLEEAAIRETLEETGIHISIERMLCTAVMDVPEQEYRGINVYFYATVIGDTILCLPKSDEPIQEIAFLDLSQVKRCDIHPVDLRILTRWRCNKTEQAFYSRVLL
jgi:8-oxo-dGTP pyrophosphatase MutT (NUDIX family)